MAIQLGMPLHGVRIREYVDAGAEVVFLSSACPADYADRNEEIIAREVLPAFK